MCVGWRDGTDEIHAAVKGLQARRLEPDRDLLAGDPGLKELPPWDDAVLAPG